MPKYLVLSDIHANLEALTAVLDHAVKTNGKPDAIWCLGDLVGYGPDPGPCIDLLRDGHVGLQGVPRVFVKGNHDEGALRMGRGLSVENTSPAVTQSWAWSYMMLTPQQREFLEQLPLSATPHDVAQPVLLVHASPPNSMYRYLQTPSDVDSCLDHFEQRICFFGHTHLPCYFEGNLTRREVKPRLFTYEKKNPPWINLDPQNNKLLLNPGAVGQPRWGRLVPKKSAPYPGGEYVGITEATYIWLELQAEVCRVRCHYVPYKYEETIKKMDRLRTASPPLEVPTRWKERLSEGIR